MNLLHTIHRVEMYGDTHHPRWMDAFRILLGLVLLFKGIVFITDTKAIEEMLTQSGFFWGGLAAAHYIATAHLVGGILITIGLLTRVAVVFQLPILLGAVIFVNAPKGFFSVGGELELSIAALFLLIFFLLYGSGPFSVDAYLQRKQEQMRQR